MDYTPVTPFRRPVTAGLLKQQVQAPCPASIPVSKWDALRALATAREHYGLSDRDLTVLQALISFHPATELGEADVVPVVYPSNKAICERLNGMPCSTMRRHIARLVDAGIILRRDSPNGKRYVRRGGGAKTAFGFDLSPLAARFAEFNEAATAIKEADDRKKRLRETVSLMRRDLAGLVAYGAETHPDLPLWDRLSDLALLTARDLRRKLGVAELLALRVGLATALAEVHNCFDTLETADPSTSDARNEQHHQKSDKELSDPEATAQIIEEEASNPPSAIPLEMVLGSCREIQSYAPEPVRRWDQMVRLADVVRPMMGVDEAVWAQAKSEMGPREAAVVLGGMLERFSEIKSPGAYLRSLTLKAARGVYSGGGMIRALSRKVA